MSSTMHINAVPSTPLPLTEPTIMNVNPKPNNQMSRDRAPTFKRRMSIRKKKHRLKFNHYGGTCHERSDFLKQTGVLDQFKRMKDGRASTQAHCVPQGDASAVPAPTDASGSFNVRQLILEVKQTLNKLKGLSNTSRVNVVQNYTPLNAFEKHYISRCMLI